MEMDAINTQLKLSVSNLGLRVKTGNKEMQREMQKVSGDKLSDVTNTGNAESSTLQLQPSRMWNERVTY